mmetsp:Transcript_30360/g.99140  ORF Transcript_30360/g.99140 Transcript_30360/m.99140 type:complete len:311 (-) Transcript_30360:560-1492(-)
MSGTSYSAALHANGAYMPTPSMGGVHGAQYGRSDYGPLGASGIQPYAPQASSHATEFAMHRANFPALPGRSSQPSGGAASASGPSSAQPAMSSSAAGALRGGDGARPAGGEAAISSAALDSATRSGPTLQYGLLGLLRVLRATEPDTNMLALGTDLMSLGLNLNSPECLYATFNSPWSAEPAPGAEPEFALPACYAVPAPAANPQHVTKFETETLLYIFYSMPSDLFQTMAAQELYRRKWRYHTRLKLWFADAADVETGESVPAGTPVVFDLQRWAVRRYSGEPLRDGEFLPASEIHDPSPPAAPGAPQS